MSLSSTSSDVLREVFSYLSATELVALIPTCKPLYQAIVHRGTVETWSESLKRRHWTPPVVNKLTKLKKVSLYCVYPSLSSISSSRLNLHLAFGPLLQHLELRGNGTIGLLLLSGNPYVTSPLQPGPPSPLVWNRLCDILPLLQTLLISDWQNLRANLELPDCFPRSLTSLSFETPMYSQNQYAVTFPSLEQLKSLTHLKLNPARADSNLQAQILALPHLTSLHVAKLEQDYILPPGLLSATVGGVGDKEAKALVACRELTLNSYHQLLNPKHIPPHVTSISAHVTDFEAFAKALPPTVTRVDVRNCWGTPAVLLAFLPDSVIYFHGSFYLSGPEDLAKALTAQNTAHFEKTGALITRWLPPKLKNLEVYSLSHGRPHSWWEFFPKSLEKLGASLANQGPSKVLSQDLRSILPNLTGNLSLAPPESSEICVPFYDWTFPLGLNSISIEFPIDNNEKPLPKGTSSLAEAILSLPLDRWPKSLKSLALRWKDGGFTKINRLDTLPHTIESLTLDRMAPPPDRPHRIPDWSVIKNEFNSSLVHLPPRLRTLDFSHIYVGDPEILIKHLPPTLTFFECKKLSSFTDDMVPLLPPKLETLVVRHAQSLTDEGVAMMPRSISSLELKYNRAITVNVFSVCSPNLGTLSIPKNKNLRRGMKSTILALLAERGMAVSVLAAKLKIHS